jgi:serine/threonine protein kinase
VLYHAPEWATGRVGPTADIYALGMVLHEMLNGALEYTKYNGDEASDRIRKGRRAIPDADLLPAAHVPDRLQRIIHRAMHRDPSKRYQRPADFRAALMASRVIGWRRTTDGWEGPDSGTLCVYRVQEEPRRSGLRLSVMRQTHRDGPWRRFGVDDRDIAADDREGYAVFFDDVLARAFQRRAT